MTAALTHRGPDDGGLWTDPAAGVGLGHRRLAILDLSPQRPPADGLGERAAGADLQRRDLQLPRAAPRARGPGRRLPRQRRQRGPARRARALRRRGRAGAHRRDVRLRAVGPPSSAASRSRATTSASSRSTGRTRADELAFASELARPRSRGQHWSPVIDRDALAAYARWNYVPAPHAIFEGVRKLRPGHLVSLDRRRPARGAPLLAPRRGRARAHPGARRDDRTNPRSWPVCARS